MEAVRKTAPDRARMRESDGAIRQVNPAAPLPGQIAEDFFRKAHPDSQGRVKSVSLGGLEITLPPLRDDEINEFNHSEESGLGTLLAIAILR